MPASTRHTAQALARYKSAAIQARPGAQFRPLVSMGLLRHDGDIEFGSTILSAGDDRRDTRHAIHGRDDDFD